MSKKLKRRKWYSIDTKPDVEVGLIAMTDMGYVFEAEYDKNSDQWKCSTVVNNKVYFEPYDAFIRWMKI